MTTKLDPYQILNVGYDANLEEIREQFKKLILKAHPDKGGNPKVFQIIKQAYSYLYKYKKKEEQQLKREQKTFDQYTNNRGLQSDALVHEFNKTQHKQMKINPNSKNFDSRTFNKLFSQNKIEDADDKGYSTMKSTTERLDASEIQLKYKENKVKKMQLAIIEEPEPMELSSGNYKQLGQEHVDDFSKKHSGNNQGFMDYKQAYTEHTDINTMGNVRNQQDYTNVDNLVSSRSNIKYEMNPEQVRMNNMRMKQEQMMEEKRRFNFHKQTQQSQKQFRQLQNYLTFNE